MKLMNVFNRSAKTPQPSAPLYFKNTLTNELQEFRMPARVQQVRMYNCGPTLYGPQHIGNLSMFVFTNILRRTLEYNGLVVKQVINFTDFGHLSSDADEGEDKMTQGLKREKMSLTMENMRALAEKYGESFLSDLRTLNIDTSPITFPRASDYVPGQIAMIRALEEKGYAYRGAHGVYFDTARFPAYGALGNIHLEGQKSGARVEDIGEKRSPTDFVLWKSDTKMGWDSPWGKGFPGWHIECSAMIRATLGEQIDIHTGGIEHIPVHHNNEIAQSEAATGKRPLARFWLHRAHIQIDGAKIAKSTGNTVFLEDIANNGYHPYALRYLFLGAHYRTPANFSWPALEAAQTAFLRLRFIVDTYEAGGKIPQTYRSRIHERFNDDVDTAGALAVLWEMIKDETLTKADVRAGILDADRVFGLGFDTEDERAANLYKEKFGEAVQTESLPPEVQKLLLEREEARASRAWDKADEIRAKLVELGYEIKDTATGARVIKI